MKPDRPERKHPIAEFVHWLFAPVVAWWSFLGVLPFVIYTLIGLLAAGLLVRVLGLFLGK